MRAVRRSGVSVPGNTDKRLCPPPTAPVAQGALLRPPRLPAGAVTPPVAYAFPASLRTVSPAGVPVPPIREEPAICAYPCPIRLPWQGSPNYHAQPLPHARVRWQRSSETGPSPPSPCQPLLQELSVMPQPAPSMRPGRFPTSSPPLPHAPNVLGVLHEKDHMPRKASPTEEAPSPSHDCSPGKRHLSRTLRAPGEPHACFFAIKSPPEFRAGLPKNVHRSLHATPHRQSQPATSPAQSAHAIQSSAPPHHCILDQPPPSSPINKSATPVPVSLLTPKSLPTPASGTSSSPATLPECSEWRSPFTVSSVSRTGPARSPQQTFEVFPENAPAFQTGPACALPATTPRLDFPKGRIDPLLAGRPPNQDSKHFDKRLATLPDQPVDGAIRQSYVLPDGCLGDQDTEAFVNDVLAATLCRFPATKTARELAGLMAGLRETVVACVGDVERGDGARLTQRLTMVSEAQLFGIYTSLVGTAVLAFCCRKGAALKLSRWLQEGDQFPSASGDGMESRYQYLSSDGHMLSGTATLSAFRERFPGKAGSRASLRTSDVVKALQNAGYGANMPFRKSVVMDQCRSEDDLQGFRLVLESFPPESTADEADSCCAYLAYCLDREMYEYVLDFFIAGERSSPDPKQRDELLRIMTTIDYNGPPHHLRCIANMVLELANVPSGVCEFLIMKLIEPKELRAVRRSEYLPWCHELFVKLRRRGIKPKRALFDTLMHEHALLGDCEGVTMLFRQMQQCDLEPDARTYTTVLAGHAQVGDIVSATNLLNEMRKNGLLERDRIGRNRPQDNLVLAYCRAGRVNAGYKAMLRMNDEGLHPGVVAWSMLIHAALRENRAELSNFLFDEMIRSGVVPDDIALSGILGACRRNTEVTAALEASFKLLAEMRGGKPTSHSCVIMASHYAFMGDANSLAEMHRAIRAGSRPLDPVASGQDVIVRTKLIFFLGRTHNLEGAVKVFESIAADGLQPNMASVGALMAAFITARRPEEAIRLFRSVAQVLPPDTQSYNLMMTAFGDMRDLHGAVNVFEEMLGAHVLPNAGTYKTILTI
ncbi:MAG: hypothetical protein BJ554DRAFT_2936, partial [Olpidium bornovanus]